MAWLKSMCCGRRFGCGLKTFGSNCAIRYASSVVNFIGDGFFLFAVFVIALFNDILEFINVVLIAIGSLQFPPINT